MSASKRLKIDPVFTRQLPIRLFENEVSKAGFKKGVVGLSGGVDSAADCSFAANFSFAATCYLAASALWTANFVAMRFPYRESADENLEQAQLDVKEFEIYSETVDITPFVEPIFNSVEDGQSRLSFVARLGHAASLYNIVNTHIGE
jgi:NAD+ synthase